MDRNIKIYISIFVVLLLIVAGAMSYVLSRGIGIQRTTITWEKYLSSDIDKDGTIYILSNMYQKVFRSKEEATQFLANEKRWEDIPGNGHQVEKAVGLYLTKYDTKTGLTVRHLLRDDVRVLSSAIRKSGDELYVFWVQQEYHLGNSWTGEYFLNWGTIDSGYVLNQLNLVDRRPEVLPGPMLFPPEEMIQTVEFFPNYSTAVLSGSFALYSMSRSDSYKTTDYNITTFEMDKEGNVHFLDWDPLQVTYYEFGMNLRPSRHFNVSFNNEDASIGYQLHLMNQVPSIFFYSVDQSNILLYQAHIGNGPVNISTKNSTPFDSWNCTAQPCSTKIGSYVYDRYLILVNNPDDHLPSQRPKPVRIYDASKNFTLYKDDELEYTRSLRHELKAVHGRGNGLYFISQDYHWVLDGGESQITIQEM